MYSYRTDMRPLCNAININVYEIRAHWLYDITL